MLKTILADTKTAQQKAKPVYLVSKEGMAALPADFSAWIKANGFNAGEGDTLLVPNEKGEIIAAILGVKDDPFVAGVLPKKLPDGLWYIADFGGLDAYLVSLGYCLGAYQFTHYKKGKSRDAKLVIDKGVDRAALEREVEATFLARDLINVPAGEMGPDEIERAARKLAKTASAKINVIAGDNLLKQNFPMVHAVGRASTIAPRLIDMVWGDKKAPRVTLVGKGVAFDTGGLDIKPASSMRNMKKDMGGAANVLALASMIMSAKLKVRLRVLIPAVENAIAGNAFRPGDVLKSRKGLTVEIGHTDAEGRLILADALTLASEEKPDMIVDMATLTGAARVAVGPELAPYFSNNDDFATSLDRASAALRDPVWRMPLWQNYNKALWSHVADLNNVTTDGFAGSITAALFLQRFVDENISWAHFDIFGWNPATKPHAPVGGEAQAIRALFAALSERYSA